MNKRGPCNIQLQNVTRLTENGMENHRSRQSIESGVQNNSECEEAMPTETQQVSLQENFPDQDEELTVTAAGTLQNHQDELVPTKQPVVIIDPGDTKQLKLKQDSTAVETENTRLGDAVGENTDSKTPASESTCGGASLELDELMKIMSPLLISLRICGMCFTKPTGAESPEENSSRWCKLTPSLIYSTVLLCLIWLDFARSMLMFDSGFSISLEVLTKLLFQVWLLLLCINFSSFYHSFQAKHGIAHFLGSWVKLVPKRSKFVPRLRKLSLTSALICWCFVAANTAYCVSAIYQTTLFDNQYVPFDADHEYIDILRPCLIVLQTFRTCVWTFPAPVFYITCSILQWQFDKITADFEEIKHDPAVFERLSWFRRSHQKMCHLVELTNVLKKYYITLEKIGVDCLHFLLCRRIHC